MDFKTRFGGVIVPMVTPFNADFTVDEGAVSVLVESFVAEGVKPFVLGTTGEGPSLSGNQKMSVIREAVRSADGKVPVFAGISSNSLFSSVEEASRYAGMGVDALVSTLPNFFPVNEFQILQWFEKLAGKITLPLFLYNMPATIRHSLTLDTIEELSHHPNIAGIKDSEHDRDRLGHSLERWKSREDFIFLVGWSAMSVYGLSRGAAGIVPGMGNLVPGLFRRLFDEMRKGNADRAQKIQEHTDILAQRCTGGKTLSYFIPALKALMAMEGLCQATVLPPLVQMDPREEAGFCEMMNPLVHANPVVI